MDNLDVSKVNRVEVIDENGRSYVKYNVTKTEFSPQDEGRTLKIFLGVDTDQSELEKMAENARQLGLDYEQNEALAKSVKAANPKGN